MSIAYLGIGANHGDSLSNIEKAIDILSSEKTIKVINVSSIYETKPQGGPPGQDMYLNGVIALKTKLGPEELLKTCLKVEEALWRARLVKNGSRTIDLDVLLYDDIVVNGDNLKIPHPRMHEREFVLKGLCEINPGKIHPVLKKRLSELYADLLNK